MSVEILGKYLTDRTPFGPIKSEDMSSDDGLAAFRALYSSGTEVHQRLEYQRPNCLLGRKGSGKTAFLLGKLIQNGSNVVRLRQASLFSGMENVVRSFYANDWSINAEIFAELWDGLIVHVVAVRLMDTIQEGDPDLEKEIIWTYIRGIEDEGSLDPEDTPIDRSNATTTWFTSELQRLIETTDERQAGDQLLAQLEVNGYGFAELRRACQRLTDTRGKQPVILVDTLEDFGPNFNRLAEVSRGLLHLLAIHDYDYGYELFVCLPSEVSGLMREISANPAKSLERSLTIEWKSRELVKLAAHRFSLYLSIHDPDAYRRLGANNSDRIPFVKARKILEATMPPRISNRLGTQEQPLMYIMRHTQLLPRQLIQILNWIWRENASLGQSPLAVSEEAILRGVREAEGALVEDVLSGYLARHPLAAEVCSKVIPRLHLRTGVDLVMREIKATKTQDLIGGHVDDVLQLLVDVGALGRLRQTTTHYDEATFSFTERRMPPLQRDEEACVHPAFAEYFQTVEVRSGQANGALPVYAFGVGEIDDDR